jgi:hypothetical protein
MFATNTYDIHIATDEDTERLRHLAERSAQRPLTGRILVAQRDGSAIAALSLEDGRAVADPSRLSGHVVANLRMRADALRAHEAEPSLPERLRAALPARYLRGTSATAQPIAEDHDELALAA